MEAGARKLQVKAGVKWRMLLTGLLVMLLVLIGGTFAVLNAQTNKVTNAFGFGRTTIRIEEDPVTWDAKHVWLRNTGTVSGVVRSMIVPVLKVKDAGGNYVPTGGDLEALGAPVGNVVTIGDLEFVFKETFAGDSSANWFYKDGYFYYNKVLAPNGLTAQLLEKVQLKAGVDASKYVDYQIEVEVLADILQAANGAPEEAWGVIVDLSAGTVSKP